MSPIPYSFQEQEDTRDSPRKGRHQVGHFLASVSSPLVFHRSNMLIIHLL